MGERRAFARTREEGTSVWSVGGRFTIKIDGDEAEGRVSLVEVVAFRTTEPPLHIHHSEDEAWYVLDGRITFYVGDESFVAGPGTLVYGPKGVPHAFTVDIEPTRVLVLATPSGFEHFALDLATRPATSDEAPPDLAPPTPEAVG